MVQGVDVERVRSALVLRGNEPLKAVIPRDVVDRVHVWPRLVRRDRGGQGAGAAWPIHINLHGDRGAGRGGVVRPPVQGQRTVEARDDVHIAMQGHGHGTQVGGGPAGLAGQPTLTFAVAVTVPLPRTAGPKVSAVVRMPRGHHGLSGLTRFVVPPVKPHPEFVRPDDF